MSDAVAANAATPGYAPSSSDVVHRLWGLPAGVILAVGAVFVLATAGIAVALPLATYTLSLAMFGLAHVLSELRYVDTRFSPRLGWRLRVGMVSLLAGVVALRALYLGGMIDPGPRQLLELMLVATLAAFALPWLWKRGPLTALVGLAVAGSIATGGLVAPALTLLLLSVLHNFTPIGFLAERLRGRAWWLAMGICALVFLVVPAIIATGLPMRWLAAAGLLATEASLLPGVGTLETHLGVYVPGEWQADLGLAIPLFSAAVFLQCMHYAVVIHVLPRLDPDRWTTEANTVKWPAKRMFLLMLLGTGALLFVGFVASFGQARSIYGLAAAVHAWIEIPILLLALALPATPLPDTFAKAEPAA